MSKLLAIAIILSLATFVSVFDVAAGPTDSKKKSRQVTVKTKSSNKDLMRGRDLFSSNCASCHPAGGNKVSPSKPINGSWTLSTLSTFKAYLEKPVGTMPHYEHIITDAKSLKLLYEYVKTLDATGVGKKSRPG